MNQLYTTLIIIILSIQVAFPQTCKDNIIASTPDSRFTVNEQEVIDNQTGLIWQKCRLTWDRLNDNDCSLRGRMYTWREALQAAETERERTGKAWRLPNIKELYSIVEDKCYAPAINITIFPNTYYAYWSASSHIHSWKHGYISDKVYIVSFYSGRIEKLSEMYSNGTYVRLVRTGSKK